MIQICTCEELIEFEADMEEVMCPRCGRRFEVRVDEYELSGDFYLGEATTPGGSTS